MPTPEDGKVVGLLKELKVKPKNFGQLFKKACVSNPRERSEAVLSLISFFLKNSSGEMKELETKPIKI